MKKIYALILAFAMALSLSACSLRDITESVMPTPTPAAATPRPTPKPEPTPEPTPEPEPDSPYKTVLDKYYLALSENWGPSALMENEMNYLMVMYSETDMLSDTGYYIGDLDGDGKDELIIGNIGSSDFVANMVYDFYVLGDDGLSLLFSCSERDRLYLCDNGQLFNELSYNSAHSENVFYTYSGGKRDFLEAVVFDAAMDPEASWFYTSDYHMVPETMKPMTSDKADDFLAEKKSHVIRLDYIPFADYPNQEW